MQSNKENQNHMIDWLHRRGISDEVISLFDISIYDHDQIGPCIRIPVKSSPTPFNKYRRDPLDERKPKYLYDQGGKVSLFGCDSLAVSGSLVITEGELDTLVLRSLNIQSVSSTGGAMSFQEEWKTLLSNFEVYLCFDNDDAGAEGMVKVLEYIPDAKIIFIPEQPGVKDISDFVSRGGDFHALMATAKSYASITEVEADRAQRLAQWLPIRFHDKYIDKKREKEHRANRLPVDRSDIKDEVLRAKAYPIGNLIEFNRNKAICPWHNEKTPSLNYYTKTNSCYCFGSCGRAYDSIDAYMKIHNVGFLQAVEELNKLT